MINKNTKTNRKVENSYLSQLIETKEVLKKLRNQTELEEELEESLNKILKKMEKEFLSNFYHKGRKYEISR